MLTASPIPRALRAPTPTRLRYLLPAWALLAFAPLSHAVDKIEGPTSVGGVPTSKYYRLRAEIAATPTFMANLDKNASWVSYRVFRPNNQFFTVERSLDNCILLEEDVGTGGQNLYECRFKRFELHFGSVGTWRIEALGALEGRNGSDQGFGDYTLSVQARSNPR